MKKVVINVQGMINSQTLSIQLNLYFSFLSITYVRICNVIKKQ